MGVMEVLVLALEWALILFVIFFIYLRLTRTKRKLHRRQRKLQEQKTWLEIKEGDSQVKVARMLGRPNSVEMKGIDSEQQIWIYDCGEEGKRIINFKDGFIEETEVKY